jgi:hypothetical protein
MTEQREARHRNTGSGLFIESFIYKYSLSTNYASDMFEGSEYRAE